MCMDFRYLLSFYFLLFSLLMVPLHEQTFSSLILGLMWFIWFWPLKIFVGWRNLNDTKPNLAWQSNYSYFTCLKWGNPIVDGAFKRLPYVTCDLLHIANSWPHANSLSQHIFLRVNSVPDSVLSTGDMRAVSKKTKSLFSRSLHFSRR